MEFITPKIEIYKTRTFSEKLSDTFALMREGWRPLLKYFFYLMLPASIVLAFFMNHFWEGYMKFISLMERHSGFDNSDMWSMLFTLPGLVVVGAVTYVLLGALVFAMIRLYRRREQRLNNLETDELKPELMHCLGRATVLTLALFGVALVYLLLVGAVVGLLMLIHTAVGVLGLVLVYGVTLALVVPLSLVEPIYMMEDDINVWGALGKAFRLGFATYGGVIAVSFILGLLASVMQTVTSMPWYVLYFVKVFFMAADKLEGSFVDSFFYTIVEYISCVLQCLGMLLSAVITTVGLTIQYGHASDKIDGVGVAQNIENFDELDKF